jgi:uncharacterized membrane protein
MIDTANMFRLCLFAPVAGFPLAAAAGFVQSRLAQKSRGGGLNIHALDSSQQNVMLGTSAAIIVLVGLLVTLELQSVIAFECLRWLFVAMVVYAGVALQVYGYHCGVMQGLARSR